MAFLPLIPQPTDQLSISQANILNNFTILGAIAGNATAGSASLNNTAGFNFLYSRNIGAAPAYVAGTTKIWTQTYATTTRGELFVGNDTTPLAGIPITAAGFTTNGWAYLPSGILWKWGNSTAGTTVNIDVQSGGPAFTQVFARNVTPFGGSPYSFTTGGSAAPGPTITVTSSPTLAQFYYSVIGY